MVGRQVSNTTQRWNRSVPEAACLQNHARLSVIMLMTSPMKPAAVISAAAAVSGDQRRGSRQPAGRAAAASALG